MLTLTPETVHSTVYQKRDHMAVFQHDSTTGRPAYRRFPHILSRIADSAKYGVFTSQLHRFAALCYTFPAFKDNAVRLLTEMVQHGYIYNKLRHRLRQFRLSFIRIQQTVFHKTWSNKHTLRHKMLHETAKPCKALFTKWHGMLHICDQRFR